MPRILIADSGSTKTHWCCIDRRWPQERVEFFCEGLNPNYVSGEDTEASVRSCLPQEIVPEDISEVYFYGAGVREPQAVMVKAVLGRVFTCAETVFAASDTLGSARALLGRSAGLAVILGTGMNSCLYDGERIILNIGSLGFILGDEGSGGYIGKRLLRDFMRGGMPENVMRIVAGRIGMSADELISQIYTRPCPNRFCAQFSRFVWENLDSDPYFRNLVEESFRSMFRNVITLYPDYAACSFNCVGSVGHAFREILGAVCAEYGMKLGRVLRYPMEGLVEFHLS